MFKTLFASTALGALLAKGAFAQTATETTDPAADPAAPVVENEASPAEVMESPDAEMTAEEAAPLGDPARVAIPEGWEEMDPSTVSAENLIGADIKTFDGEKVASIGPSDWKISRSPSSSPSVSRGNT